MHVSHVRLLFDGVLSVSQSVGHGLLVRCWLLLLLSLSLPAHLLALYVTEKDVLFFHPFFLPLFIVSFIANVKEEKSAEKYSRLRISWKEKENVLSINTAFCPKAIYTCLALVSQCCSGYFLRFIKMCSKCHSQHIVGPTSLYHSIGILWMLFYFSGMSLISCWFCFYRFLISFYSFFHFVFVAGAQCQWCM